MAIEAANIAVSMLLEEHLYTLLANVKEDTVLRSTFSGTAELNIAVYLAGEACFDVSEDDWLRIQAKHSLEFGDPELKDYAKLM